MFLIFQEPEDEVFLAIAKAMEEMVEDSVDCYWITRCFVNQLDSKYRDFLPQLVRADAVAAGARGSGGEGGGVTRVLWTCLYLLLPGSSADAFCERPAGLSVTAPQCCCRSAKAAINRT